MGKYTYAVFLMVLRSTISQAQELRVIAIKDPIVDSTLMPDPIFARLDAPRYLVNNKYVVYQKNDTTRKILDVDIRSFRLPQDYQHYNLFALDKNGIYFDGDFIETDTTGFKILAEIRTTDCKAGREVIWKTNTKIFNNNTEIKEDIDPASFRPACSSDDCYFKDKNYIYYRGRKIEGSDAAFASESFQNMIYDKSHVYIDGEIALYKGDTLRPVNHFLVKTSNVVLTRKDLKILSHIDAKTMEIKFMECSGDRCRCRDI